MTNLVVGLLTFLVLKKV